MTPARAPIAYDHAAGSRAVAACAPPADWAEVVAGAAGSAPFLAALFAREADWLSDVWTADPGATLDRLLADLRGRGGDPRTPLRVAKRRVAALVALADLGGAWDTMAVCAALTRFADLAVAECLSFGLARAKGVPDEPGLVAFAMGKMGAGELNYSSDVDLILLFDQDRHAPRDYATVRAVLIRAARMATAALSEVTADGYVFRTDLRLRPDPASTPVVQTMEAAERYYEAVGRTWERAAWIKARPCAGDVAAGARTVAALRPFVWRRHLDFAAVQDAHDMRLAIREARGMGQAWDVPGHDVKLGQGGIREIEFYAQTRQLIAGGRDPSLRDPTTLGALDALVGTGWVERDDAMALARCYRRLRDVEHRIQMTRDAQTHRIPDRPADLDRLARLDGTADTAAFVAGLRADLRSVEAIVDPFFRPASAPASAPAADPAWAAPTIARWASYPALRSERARRTFARLQGRILAMLSDGGRREEALAAFDGFLRGLPAGAQLFALFESNPNLLVLVVDICATAPDLARFLGGNAVVLDAVLDGTFFAPLDAPAPPDLPPEFEPAMDVLRRWHRERHFRIGVHLLRRLATPREGAAAYAALAEATVGAALTVAFAETARRYGRVAGLRVCVLAMGSLGAAWLSPRSDLDLVVIHEGGEGVSDGPRALGPGQWAARLTQTLITVLSARTGAGRLYEVDMRLRPSGRQGPVAVTRASWSAYQSREAWVWEHLALSRARPVAGDAALRAAVEADRGTLLRESRFDCDAVIAGCAEMIGRLRSARPAGHGIAVRAGPGRIQEIELVAQAHALIGAVSATGTAEQLAVAGWLTPDARASLTEAHVLLARVSIMTRLMTAAEPPVLEGATGPAVLAATAGLSDADAVARACDVAAGRAADAIGSALAGHWA